MKSQRMKLRVVALITLPLLLLSCSQYMRKQSNFADIQELNKIANDSANDHIDRCNAVFNLFSNHISPGCKAPDLKKVLTNLKWLDESEFYFVDELLGKIPVDINFENDTVCAIHLFVDKLKNDSFTIFLRFKGGIERNNCDQSMRYLDYSVLQKQAVISFLKGNSKSEFTALLEFALCHHYDRVKGGCKRFSK